MNWEKPWCSNPVELLGRALMLTGSLRYAMVTGCLLLAAGLARPALGQQDLERWELRPAAMISDDRPGVVASVTSIVEGAGGRVFVATARDSAVRSYGRSGELLQVARLRDAQFGALGARGFMLGLRHDTLFAVDRETGVVTMLDGELAPLHQFRPKLSIADADYSGGSVQTLLPGGLVLMGVGILADALADGRVTRSPLLRTDRAGIVQDTFVWRSVERVTFRVERGGVQYNGTRPIVARQFFAWSPDARHFAFVDQVPEPGAPEFRLLLIDAVGALRAEESIVVDVRPLDASHRAAIMTLHAGRLQRAMSLAEDEAYRLAERALDLPAEYPPIDGVVVSSGGNVWVRRANRPGREREWLVYDRDAVPIATFVLAAEYTVLTAVDDGVWATRRHPDGETVLVRLEMERSEG
jgi:hypothetical protein